MALLMGICGTSVDCVFCGCRMKRHVNLHAYADFFFPLVEFYAISTSTFHAYVDFVCRIVRRVNLHAYAEFVFRVQNSTPYRPPRVPL